MASKRNDQQEDEGQGGFSFDLCHRNEALAARGSALPKFRKTGTTLAGAVFKGGVVLGADTRATRGDIVSDKNCEKIHFITESIRCCGAGTAADTQFVTEMVSRQMELHQFATGRNPRVVTALTIVKSHLFQYQGHVSAALILGGFDFTGPHLYTIFPHGSTDTLPFASMGSGSLAAMAVLESGYKEDLTREECMSLVANAIKGGIFNDLGSGSNVDLAVITKDGCEMLRNYEKPTPRTYRSSAYSFPKGSTKILSEAVELFKHHVIVTEGGGEAMEE